jgi:hypothetical protein
MNTTNLNQQLNKLEKDVALYFSKLLELKSEYVFSTQEDLEDDILEYYLEVRNSITGSVSDVHPMRVDKRGVVCVTADGEYNEYTFTFSEIGSIQERINLCELMESQL